jgi:uncharacterized membrane protein YoaK (UPF0700 family)
MRISERDFLLVVLAMAAGSADGWSYFGLGHSFVANMTGNTVLIGLAIFQINGDVVHPFISLSFYCTGVLFATYLTRRIPPGDKWRKPISLALLVEAFLMTAAAVIWATRHHSMRSHFPGLNVLLAGVAFAIGIQSGAMLQLRIPGIVTTYITGTWTNLISGLVRRFASESKRLPGTVLEFEHRLFLQAGILAAYFVSAAITGWLFRSMPEAAGVLPAGCVLLVAIYAMFGHEVPR